MGNLYELTRDYMELLGRLDEAPEEAEQIFAALEALNEDIGEKAEAYARIIQSKEREAEMYAAEIKRLQSLKTGALNIVDRLRGNLLASMLLAEVPALSTSIGTWKVKSNPKSVMILDERLIPERFFQPQPMKLDKRAMLAEHKETGEIFPGVDFVNTKRVEFR